MRASYAAWAIALALAVAPLGVSSVNKRASAADAPVRRGDPVNGLRWVRALGPRAEEMLAPVSHQIAGLVRLPPGKTAADLGLQPVTDTCARIRGSREQVLAFGDAHPDLGVEVAPPLKLLLDSAGRWTRALSAHAAGVDGRGAMVGIADTGLDVTHPDFRNADGTTRVAWMLDLSLAPAGLHPDLEAKYSIRNNKGAAILGAVLSRADIDAILASNGEAPIDVIGHGSHVTGIAAGNGHAGTNVNVGMAPGADIVSVRLTRTSAEAIENDDLVRAIQFMFEVADADKKPLVANVSLGSDFGSHDGNMAWEQVIASYVGPGHPGHALVAAAGNSGSVADLPIHQIVRASKGSRMRVPVSAGQTKVGGTVRVWAALPPTTHVEIGLESSDGATWIEPQSEGASLGLSYGKTNVSIVYGEGAKDSEVPKGARGAIVAWTGLYPKGNYNITLDGEGLVDLYLETYGEASTNSTGFVEGMREGTINLPATNPGVIGVGCTVNKVAWKSFYGQSEVAFRVPNLDAVGGRVTTNTKALFRAFEPGEVCYFSSAGPNVNGVPKPEISAPGGVVGSSMSAQAPPGSRDSIFTNSGCPKGQDGKPDFKCYQIDATHAISAGTSMASPMVAGVIALLFQKDPTLTQDKIVAVLQGGAHPFRGAAPFDDQSGPGELDAVGALDALAKMQAPVNVLPELAGSWLTLSSGFLAADGALPMTAIVELRTANGERADFFDRGRLAPVVRVGGIDVAPTSLVRKGPGVWSFQFTAPPGYGGTFATVGATFDGKPIVASKRVAVATDPWNARYASAARGGSCAVTHIDAPGPFGAGGAGAAEGGILGISVALACRRRRQRRTS